MPTDEDARHATMDNPYQSPASPPEPSSPLATRVRWLVFVLACGTSFMLYLHRYTWNIIRPQLEAEYGFNNTELEAIFTVFYFGYAFFQIPSGIICDLFGPHFFLAAITLGWSLSLPLMAVTGNLYVLGGLRLLFGSMQAGGYPCLGQVTRVWFHRSIRTRVQGFVASFFGRGGGAMSSIIMATILMGYCGMSWRAALFIMAGLGVAFAAAIFRYYRNRPADDPRVNEAELALIQGDQAPEEGTRRLLPFGKALRNRNMRLMVFQQFMNAGADIVYTSVMGSYFLSKGISDAQLGILVSLPLWGGALGGIVGGYLNDWLIRTTGSRRWGRAMIGVSGKTIAAGVLFIAIAQRNPLAAGIGLFVVKFFSDWTQPTVWGTCTDLGGRHSATVFSINNTSGNVGALVTPLVIGPLLDFYTTVNVVNGITTKVTNYTPMFMLVAALYVIGASCWFLIDCSKPIASE